MSGASSPEEGGEDGGPGAPWPLSRFGLSGATRRPFFPLGPGSGELLLAPRGPLSAGAAWPLSPGSVSAALRLRPSRQGCSKLLRELPRCGPEEPRRTPGDAAAAAARRAQGPAPRPPHSLSGIPCRRLPPGPAGHSPPEAGPGPPARRPRPAPRAAPGAPSPTPPPDARPARGTEAAMARPAGARARWLRGGVTESPDLGKAAGSEPETPSWGRVSWEADS
nr:basic proline-rich protein-like isoform X2 [Gorilla gorilla gorilla]